MTTEQEKVQTEVEMAEKTLQPEQPEVETKSVQEQLAEQVRICVVEGRNCKDLGSKLDEVAKELGIEVNELIDQVFEIVTRREG